MELAVSMVEARRRKQAMKEGRNPSSSATASSNISAVHV